MIKLIAKKFLLIFASAALVFIMAGCGGNDNAANTEGTQTAPTESVQQAEDQSSAPNGERKILITYFTVPETDGTDTSASASRVADGDTVYGNTQYIAQLIQEETGGELFEIKTVQEYPGTHDELLDFAYNELRDDARPELESKIENLDDYDTIFIGYPNWNSELPMPMYTFFEEHDFSGKTIIPFVTHGGSGFSRTVSTIEELEPDANVVSDGLSVSRNSVADARDDVVEWVQGLDF